MRQKILLTFLGEELEKEESQINHAQGPYKKWPGLTVVGIQRYETL